MSIFAEIAIAVFCALAQLTLAVAEFSWRPVKFLFAPSYRNDILKSRRTAPGQFWFKMIGGSIALILFASLISAWTYFILSPKPKTHGITELEAKFSEFLKSEAIRRHEAKK